MEEKVVESLEREVIKQKQDYEENRMLLQNKENEYFAEMQRIKQGSNDKKKLMSKMKGDFVALKTNAKKEKIILNEEHKKQLEDIELKVKNIISSLENKIKTLAQKASDTEKRAEDAECLLQELNQSLVNANTNPM